MIFSEKLKAERAKRNGSQKDLAEKLFVSRQGVSSNLPMCIFCRLFALYFVTFP